MCDAYTGELYSKVGNKKELKKCKKMNEWQTNIDKSFDGVWDTIKKDILTKQEN